MEVEIGNGVWAVCCPSLMGGWEVITIYPENGRRENVEEKAGYENEDRLSKEEYEMTQDILLDHARMISLLPLEAFLNSLRHAKEIVPFIDPTLFLKTAYGQGRLEKEAEKA